jgi:hypothetical protein
LNGLKAAGFPLTAQKNVQNGQAVLHVQKSIELAGQLVWLCLRRITAKLTRPMARSTRVEE